MPEFSHRLLSTETPAITAYLTDRLIDSLPSQDAALRPQLRALRDAIWPQEDATRGRSRDLRGEAANSGDGRYQEIIAQVEPQQRAIFMEHVAQMGHLRQMASLIARDNFFQANYKAQNKSVPGSGQEFVLNTDRTLSEVMTAINGVIFNPVFTAHPTNNNALPSMQALNALGKAISQFRNGPVRDEDVVNKALAAYLREPVTPTKDAQDYNLSAADETANILHFMGEIYGQLPTVLKEYDTALTQKFGAEYDPLKLAPQYKFDSWGSSGDKDGNKRVNATTTLEALLQHRQKAVDLYAADLNRILQSDGLPEASRTTLKPWQSRLSNLQITLSVLHKELRDAAQEKNSNGQLTDATFDEISRKLAEAYHPETKGRGEHGGFEIAAFIRDLEQTYAAVQGAAKEGVLGLTRKARIFGENFGRLEYRETAEEFGRVARLLIGEDYPPLLSISAINSILRESEVAKRASMLKDFLPHLPAEMQQKIQTENRMQPMRTTEYKKLLEAAAELLETTRTKKLTEALQNPATMDAMRARIGEITREGQQQEYGDSPYPIAYQTIKRMELARDFPQSVVKQVLAECQGPSNALEAKLMMELAAKDGRKPVLGIVPLFEDPEILDVAHNIMRTIVNNPVYAEHLKEFLIAHPDECAHTHPDDLTSPKRITQEVQFAHSDNGRRGGMPAARAFIYKAHEELQALGKELNIAFEEFHGGSASDPYRGGTRSYIGMIRDYALQDKFKLTLQGGDLLNIFNYDGSIQRYLGGILQYCARQRLKPEQKVFSEVDHMARASLMGTLKDYTHRVFQKLGMGALFGALADLFDLGAGNTGTRQQRKGVGFQHNDSREGDSTFLDPDTIRTITFSELLQHNQINPTWVGAMELANNIRAVCAKDLPKAIAELQKMDVPQEKDGGFFITNKNRFLRALHIEQEKIEDGQEHQRALKEMQRLTDPEQMANMNTEDFYSAIRGIHPGVIQYMYQRSPSFRDVMDRMAFGLATTNLSAVEFHHKDQLDANPQARAFLRTLKREYVKAATLVHAAMTGRYPEAEKMEQRAREGSPQPLPEALPADGLNLERVRDRILSLPRLQHLKRDVEDNMALLDFINSFKDTLRHDYKEADGEISHRVIIKKYGEDVEVHLEHTDIPILLKGASEADVAHAIGSDEVVVRFEASTGQPMGGAKYLVRLIDVTGSNAADAPGFYVPHEDWLKMQEQMGSHVRADAQRQQEDAARAHIFRVVHCAADTATHVYYPTAGDRAYGRAVEQKQQARAA